VGAVNTDARNAVINDVGRDQHITYVNQLHESKEMLVSLKPVERRGYHVPPCMQRTRGEIFKEIESWLDDVDAPNVLWLSGSPGAGKSGFIELIVCDELSTFDDAPGNEQHFRWP